MKQTSYFTPKQKRALCQEYRDTRDESTLALIFQCYRPQMQQMVQKKKEEYQLPDYETEDLMQELQIQMVQLLESEIVRREKNEICI